jgi:hypothetical protein
VRDRDLRQLLVTAPLPNDLGARRRSWTVVRRAYEEREPVRRRPSLRPVLAFAVVAAAVAAALSPAGEAVVERVREAIGVERAAPALFRLPAGGRLLVESEQGPWIVHRDGSTRRLGRWREASWSPFGRFVVAARRNELAALERDGDVRWKLMRPDVRFPRWEGSRTDTRIAYLSRLRLRVVAGDGKGDRSTCADRVAPVAPAWQPGTQRVLAFVSPRGQVHVYAIDGCRLLLRSPRFAEPRALAWSDDGRRLVLVTADRVVVFRPGRWRPLAVHRLAGVMDAAFAPGSRRLALARAKDVLVLDVGPRHATPRMIFAGTGRFTDVTWSPDGRWVLVAWRDADQWVFVRSTGEGRLEAVSDVAAQFESVRFPRIASWCCAR